MNYMTDSEAKETVTDMVGAMRADILSLTQRIAELKADYAKDPWEDTAHQLNRLEERLVVKTLQAEALAIAVEKFEGITVSARTHDIDAAWKFVAESYDGQAYSPRRSEWTDAEIFEFAGEHHVNGLDAFKR